MHMGAWLFRRLAWLALCAMLFAAMAPTISKFLTTVQGVTWVEVCSINGTMQVALQQNDPQAPSDPIAADSHCAYCLLQQLTPVLHTLSNVGHGLLAPAPYQPGIHGATAVFKRFVREAHRSRAPPATA
jgi:hypothetical protein